MIIPATILLGAVGYLYYNSKKEVYLIEEDKLYSQGKQIEEDKLYSQGEQIEEDDLYKDLEDLFI